MRKNKLLFALRIVLCISFLWGVESAGRALSQPASGRPGHDVVSTGVVHDFDWMVSTTAANYSGYRDKVQDTASFSLLSDSLRALVSHAASPEESVPLFESWVRSFRDPHLAIRFRPGATAIGPRVDSLHDRFQCTVLTSTTVFLVLPSFNIRYKRTIDSILSVNEQTIRRSRNLIIDIRNNGGGSDETYGRLLPLLYTNPIIRVNSDIWSTEDNIKKYESVASDTRYSAGTREAMKALAEKLRRNIGHFVSKEEDDTLHLSTVDSLPSRVVIMVNGNVASSAEGFLLQARQSRKVVLAGQHSRGELDYANVNSLTSPSGKFTLEYPTSRSRRLPASPIDNIGIQPDIVLPAGKDWAGYVVRRVDDFEFSPVRFAHGIMKRGNEHFQWEETKDTSMVKLQTLANAIIPPGCSSTVDRVRQVIDWTNANFEWTFTDYRNRTVKEIIVRGGGNCSEQTRIARALLTQLGIKTRSISEINIQPDDEGRQARAAELVKRAGYRMSVFGLRHNDHVWIEFFDETDGQWKPADPTLGLVGIESWLMARVGFAVRPTHAIIPSRDMLVPIGIFAKDDRTGAIVEDRSDHYLIDEFNRAYGGKLEREEEWGEWTRLLHAISPKCKEAFEGVSNLHAHTELIRQIGITYKHLQDTIDR